MNADTNQKELLRKVKNIPSILPLKKGSCEKIEWKDAKASIVARGRGKSRAPKPGGRWRAVKRFPDFRRATPAACENSYKYEMVIVSASVA